MKFLTRLADWWHERVNYMTTNTISDDPPSPDYHQTAVDPLYMEEQLMKPPKKGSK